MGKGALLEIAGPFVGGQSKHRTTCGSGVVGQALPVPGVFCFRIHTRENQGIG